MSSSSSADEPTRRRRSAAAASPERFLAGGANEPATDLDTLAQQVIWLRDRARATRLELDSVHQRQVTTVCRAALAAIAIAQLVLLTIPWWVIAGEDDLGPAFGPWTLVGAGSGVSDELGIWIILAALPMLAYLGAALMILVSLSWPTPRTTVVAAGLCALAGLAILCQLAVVASVDGDSDDVTQTAAPLTALLLWVVAAAVSTRVASDTD